MSPFLFNRPAGRTVPPGSGIIFTDGSVLGVSVTNDPLGLGCGQAAADAVSQWRFQPATQGGVPVEVTTAVQVRFDIQ